MRIYFYSSELIAFIEIRWIIAKCMLAGTLLGGVLFFVVFTIDPSAAKIFRSDDANNIELENIILQRQVDVLLPQFIPMSVYVQQLHEYSDKLDQLLFRSILPGDSTYSLTVEAKTFRIQSMLFASTVLKP